MNAVVKQMNGGKLRIKVAGLRKRLESIECELTDRDFQTAQENTSLYTT